MLRSVNLTYLQMRSLRVATSIEGQFIGVPADKREACNREVKDALLSLAGEKGIPYTIHRLRVVLRRKYQ